MANANFSWKAQNSDGSLSSDWTPTKGAPGCRFVFDPNRPSTGKPDLYGIDQSGALNRFHGAGDGTVTPASGPASGLSWTSAKITHRCDWTGDGYEDLTALRPGDADHSGR
ncbi:hypothetical protein [Streptomyces shenzhenensis]|uniref:hypothetical protein n=1 Tax=Streptomyces shenzhenensis TaxID=943815 RepID=UPI0033EA02AE